MKEQEQEKALCEWVGWKDFELTEFQGLKFWTGTHPKIQRRQTLPDTDSLDVLHKMAMKVKAMSGTEWTRYNEILVTLCDGYKWDAANATAAQRREALLKTLNLWREELNV